MIYCSIPFPFENIRFPDEWNCNLTGNELRRSATNTTYIVN